jgi:hypothetical protein
VTANALKRARELRLGGGHALALLVVLCDAPIYNAPAFALTADSGQVPICSTSLAFSIPLVVYLLQERQ